MSRMLRSLFTVMLLTISFLIVTYPNVQAGKPEYMELDFQPGQAFEIKGYWDKEGIFIATDIERLPKPRRPKLRGEIQKIDYKNKTITMYGIRINVGDKTKFLEDGGKAVTFETLKEGQRVEVSCKVNDSSQWLARKIKARGVKKNNKIKATITRVAVDGKPPDTLDISGLLILLVPKTDVNKPESHLQWMEKKLFGDLSRNSLIGMYKGVQLNENIFLTGEYRQTVQNEREYDLNKLSKNNQDNIQPDIRLEMAGFWNKHFRSFAQMRFRKRYIVFKENDTTSSGKMEARFIQLYILARNIGNSGIAVQVGRQDFDEPREWLFDDYLDAIRLYYYGANSFLFEAAIIHAINPVKAKRKTWTDIFGKIQWYHNRDNSFSAYVLARRDSDEVRKWQPVWWGLRYYGKIHRVLKPWVDVAIMRGEGKHKTLHASAIDLGTTIITKNVPLVPSFTIAYARGSGDDNGGDLVDNRFRQTAYDDNTDQFGGVTSTRYYGEILNPELSNIKIVTAGVGIRPTDKSSIELMYHSYKQDKADNKIKGSKLLIPPFGNDTDIGWAVDLVIGISKLWEYVRFDWILGVFSPGEAFKPLFTDNAFLSKFNVRLEL